MAAEIARLISLNYTKLPCKKPLAVEIAVRTNQGPLNGGVSNGGGFPIWTFRVTQTVFLVNRVFVPCQKGAVLTKTAKMTNLHSTL